MASSQRLTLRGRAFAFHGIEQSNRSQWTRVLEARGASVLPHWREHTDRVFVLTDWWVDTLPDPSRATNVVCVTEYWLRESLKLGEWLAIDAHPFFTPPAAFGGQQRIQPLLLSYPPDYDDASPTLARLPCSPLNVYEDVVPLWPYISVFLREPTTTTAELVAMLQRITGDSRHRLNCLQVAIDELLDLVDREAFFDVVLPTMKQLVLELPYSFRTSLRLLSPIDTASTTTAARLQETSLHLSRAQLLPLLSAMFLAVFPAQNHIPRVEFPWFSMENMFSAPRSMSNFVLLKAHKIRTILEYFLRVVPRFLHNRDDLEQQVVTFTRVAIKTPDGSSPMHSPSTLLSALAVCPRMTGTLSDVRIETNALIEDLESHLQIDFANKYAGGGVMNGGAVQEEIRFILSPELMVTCLVFARLEPNESFVIHGSERFSNYTGYGGTFRFGGSVQDTTPIETATIDSATTQRRRQSVVVGIDAISYGGNNVSRQYSRRSILRDLTKALVGFAYPVPNTASWPIATGNWGCGVFRGDPELKFVIQWVAATLAGRSMVYVIFEQTSDLQDKITALLQVCQAAVVPPQQQLVHWIVEFLLGLERELVNSGAGHKSDRGRSERHSGSAGRRPRESVLDRAVAFIRAKTAITDSRSTDQQSPARSTPVPRPIQASPATATATSGPSPRQRTSGNANGNNGGPQLKQPKLSAFWK